MFCIACGRALAENLRFCDGCGADVTGAVRGGGDGTAGQFGSELKAKTLDAWLGPKMFARNPVEGLPQSFVQLGGRRAMQAGFLFAVAFEAFVVLGFMMFRSRAVALLGGWIPMAGVGDLTVSQFVKLIALGMVPFAGLLGACVLVRMVSKGTGQLAGDVYTAGAVILPSGLFVLLGSVVGVANFEVIAILFLFAATYTVLILYAGCSRICGIPEPVVAPAVPVILLISLWITKVLVTAIW